MQRQKTMPGAQWQWATPQQWLMRTPEMWLDWLQFGLSTVLPEERRKRRQREGMGVRGMLFQDCSVCKTLRSGWALGISVEMRGEGGACSTQIWSWASPAVPCWEEKERGGYELETRRLGLEEVRVSMYDIVLPLKIERRGKSALKTRTHFVKEQHWDLCVLGHIIYIQSCAKATEVCVHLHCFWLNVSIGYQLWEGVDGWTDGQWGMWTLFTLSFHWCT